MLKPRIIALVIIRNGLCVQSVGFERYLPVGRPEVAIEHLDAWGVDEIVCLHINRAGREADYFERIERYAKYCHVPLSVGGGVSTLERFARAISLGADKVVMNTALVTAPGVVESAARRYGSQSVVASVDYRRDGQGQNAWICGGRVPAGTGPLELALRAQDLGAGEIMLTCMDRDGKRTGYDIEMLETVLQRISVPVIVAGGAGSPAHLEQGVAAGASAVAAGNYFHFTEHSVTLAKRHLADKGRPVRLDSPFRYEDAALDERGRLNKRGADELSKLRFVKIEPVTI
jgi:cyclase